MASPLWYPQEYLLHFVLFYSALTKETLERSHHVRVRLGITVEKEDLIQT